MDAKKLVAVDKKALFSAASNDGSILVIFIDMWKHAMISEISF
jgi:hypothetical protein